MKKGTNLCKKITQYCKKYINLWKDGKNRPISKKKLQTCTKSHRKWQLMRTYDKLLNKSQKVTN